MMGKRIKLFRIFGFEIRMHPSWLLIAALVAWTLAMGVFPNVFAGLSGGAYWLMGIAGALGLFVSIVLHELSHSLVARRYGVEMSGITLFLLGGVAEMNEEPPHARAELVIAIAGPIASVVIGGACYLLAMGADAAGWAAVAAVLAYLGAINLILAVFNMLPAFPLDGGRVLRALLWGWKRDLRLATRTASRVGMFFGLMLIVLGVVSVFFGNLVGGLWWFLIGMFIQYASKSSYQQVVVRSALQGEPVSRLMSSEPVVVGPDLPVDRLVEDVVFRHRHSMYPVVEGSTLLGCVDTQQIRTIPRDEWPRHTTRELVQQCDTKNAIDPEAQASEALDRMQRSGRQRLLVARNGQLLGILSMKDILDFLSVKSELEGLDLPARA